MSLLHPPYSTSILAGVALRITTSPPSLRYWTMIDRFFCMLHSFSSNFAWLRFVNFNLLTVIFVLLFLSHLSVDLCVVGESLFHFNLKSHVDSKCFCRVLNWYFFGILREYSKCWTWPYRLYYIPYSSQVASCHLQDHWISAVGLCRYQRWISLYLFYCITTPLLNFYCLPASSIH